MKRKRQEETLIIPKFTVTGTSPQEEKVGRKTVRSVVEFRHVFPNKQEAEADIKTLRKRGVKAELHDESFNANAA